MSCNPISERKPDGPPRKDEVLEVLGFLHRDGACLPDLHLTRPISLVLGFVSQRALRGGFTLITNLFHTL